MIIVDGYNLLRCIQSRADDYEQLDDVRLCRIIDRYLAIVREKGQIVFDGIGPAEKTAMMDLANLEVVFSGRSTDADTVIERKIKASSGVRNLTVVSSDMRLRAAARTRKAASVKSEQFWLTVEKALARRSRHIEPIQKVRGLDEGQTKQWLEFFGLDE